METGDVQVGSIARILEKDCPPEAGPMQSRMKDRGA